MAEPVSPRLPDESDEDYKLRLAKEQVFGRPSTTLQAPGQPTVRPGADPAKVRRVTTMKDLNEPQKAIADWLISRGVDFGAGVAGLPGEAYEWMKNTWNTPGAMPESEAYRKLVAEQGVSARTGEKGKVVPETAPDRPAWLPTSGEIKEKVKGVVPYTETGTPGPLGEYLDAAVENLIGGAPFKFGRSVAGAVSNLMGGAAAKAAPDVTGTKGTIWEIPVSMAAGGGASLPATAIGALRSTPGAMVAKATKGVNWDEAIRRHREAGGRLMGHEAIAADQLSPIAQLFGHVQASGRGAKVTERARERLPQLGRDFEYYMERFAPGGKVDQRTAEWNLGRQAEAATKRPEIDRAAAAAPHFNRAFGAPPAGAPAGTTIRAPTPVDPTVATQMYSALMQGGHAAGPVVSRLADQMRGEFMAATTVQQFNETINKYKAILRSGAFEGSPIPDDVRAALKPILQQGKEGLSATNQDYAEGMLRYRLAGTEDPMAPGKPLPSPETQAVLEAQASPTGQIGRTAKPPAQYKSSETMSEFGRTAVGPEGGANPRNIADTVTRLRNEDQAAMLRARAQGVQMDDPQSAQRAFRLYLEENWNRAQKDLQGGPNLAGPAKFRNTVFGTADDRANVQAWVTALAGGNATVAHGFNNLLDIYRRTGITPGIGSPTASRNIAFREAREGGLANTAVDAAGMLALRPGPAKRWIEDWQHGKTFSKLADLTTDPDAVIKLQKLAMMDPNSPRAVALARTLFNTAMGGVHNPDDDVVGTETRTLK